MKCKHCNGTGTTNCYINGTFVDCPYCGGTGEMEMEMTNEEWIKSANTEQLAIVFGSMLFEAWKDGLAEEMHDKRFYENLVDFWLKQPHQKE